MAGTAQALHVCPACVSCGFSLAALGGSQPCPHLGLRLRPPELQGNILLLFKDPRSTLCLLSPQRGKLDFIGLCENKEKQYETQKVGHLLPHTRPVT